MNRKKNLLRKGWVFAMVLILSLTIIGIGNEDPDPQIREGWPQEIDVYYHPDGYYYWLGQNEAVISDLDNDGKSEIITYVSGNATRIFVYEEDGDFFDGWPIEVDQVDLPGGNIRTPTVGDVDNDGYKEIIVNGYEYFYIYNHNGSLLRKIYSYGFAHWPNGEIVLYDLDNDGDMEIIAKGGIYQNCNGSERELVNDSIAGYPLLDEGGYSPYQNGSCSGAMEQILVYNSEGNLLPGWPQLIEHASCFAEFAAAPTVGNFDDDPEKEIVITEMRDIYDHYGQRIYVYNMNGTVLNGFPRDVDGEIYGSPAVGDINNDGYDEIVIGTESGHNCGLYVIDRFGNNLSNWPQLVGNSMRTSPALADFDQDGYLEIVQGIGSFWTQDPYATYIFDYLGNVLDGWPVIKDRWDVRSSVIGDINEDRIPDIITTTDKIYAWNFDGEPIEGFPIAWDGWAAATIADIDNDGELELTASSFKWGGQPGRICIWDLSTTFNSQTMAWPMFHHDAQHSGLYQELPPIITNISSTPDTVGFGFNVNIAADVTDNISVDTVQVNITYPDSTTGNFIMNHTGGNTYEYVFSGTWLVGQYDYTIWVFDNFSNRFSSSGHSFNVSAQATLSIATLKNSYGINEYINITDPPSPPQDYYLVGRGQTWNEYYNATSGRNILEIYTSPVNYQDENGWTPIEYNISLIDNSHPAYSYGYRAGNDHGLYNVYFKPNVRDSWPVAFAYNKSTDPKTHIIRSELVGVGYLDPSQGWAYEYLQNVQSSQGQIDGNSATYENVFTGTDVVWTYGNTGLKEEIILSNATKTVLQDHPPSKYGLSNQNSYLVFITKLDYHNLQLYNSSGVLDGNFTTDGRIDFKDALGRFKCTLPIGEAYELNDESVRHRLIYRVLQYNGNYYLLSGLKASDLNDMTFPVVIDPSLTVYSSTFDGDIMGDGTPYAFVQDAVDGLPEDWESTFTIGQRCAPGPYYFIWRGFVYFDTSSIPSNDLIDSATLSLYKDSDFSFTDFDIVVQNGQPTYPHIPLLPFDYDKNRYSGNDGSFNTVGFSSGYNDISLTDYSWINADGTTKLCLRSSRDIGSIAPTGNEYVTVYSSNYPLGGRSPKLVIEYRNQSKIKNTGSTDIKGYLYMAVRYISALPDYVAVNDTTPRTVDSSEQLALDLIFNGLINTNDLTHGDGTYCVYVAFRDPDGNILKCDDETELVATYEFTITFD